VPELSLWVDCVYDVVWPLMEELEEEKVVDWKDDGILAIGII
jgi:hypothetical protein